jgi:hypothetical protein
MNIHIYIPEYPSIEIPNVKILRNQANSKRKEQRHKRTLDQLLPYRESSSLSNDITQPFYKNISRKPLLSSIERKRLKPEMESKEYAMSDNVN